MHRHVRAVRDSAIEQLDAGAERRREIGHFPGILQIVRKAHQRVRIVLRRGHSVRRGGLRDPRSALCRAFGAENQGESGSSRFHLRRPLEHRLAMLELNPCNFVDVIFIGHGSPPLCLAATRFISRRRRGVRPDFNGKRRQGNYFVSEPLPRIRPPPGTACRRPPPRDGGEAGLRPKARRAAPPGRRSRPLPRAARIIRRMPRLAKAPSSRKRRAPSGSGRPAKAGTASAAGFQHESECPRTSGAASRQRAETPPPGAARPGARQLENMISAVWVMPGPVYSWMSKPASRRRLLKLSSAESCMPSSSNRGS